MLGSASTASGLTWLSCRSEFCHGAVSYMSAKANYVPLRPRKSERLRLRGVDYHISEWGDERNPLLVYLHGWGDTGSTLQFVVDHLSERWFVVAPDWRGFGRTEYVGSHYWFPDYLADLDALLKVYSPDSAATLIGHSMGANIGGLYAGVMPERVRAFVNVEGFGLADSDPANAPANYRRWIERSAQPNEYLSYASIDELVPRILKRSPRMPTANAYYVAREWARRDADGVIRLRADPAHRLPNAVQYRRAEALACWERVEAAVLLVLGAETDFTSAAKSWIDPDESKHPFRGAPSRSIPGAGHMVHFEAPDRLAAVIDEFLLDL